MSNRSLLKELEQLYIIPELKHGFPNKENCFRWANKVAPLLRFNNEYYINFVESLNILHFNLSSETREPHWHLMISTLERAIADLKYSLSGISVISEPLKLNTPEGTYIHLKRLEELESIKNSKFDLTKLLEILREINICHQNQCYFAVIILVREVLDHIPPIFSCDNFIEVVSNYKGSRSFKASMDHLEKSARKVADQHLHGSIRKSEILPTVTQIDYSNDIDVLLAEIVRFLKS